MAGKAFGDVSEVTPAMRDTPTTDLIHLGMFSAN